MKGKISLLTRKVFATVIAIAMSIPPTAFANNDSPQIYNMDSSVMGVREDNEEKLAEVNNTDETKLEKDLGDYTLEVSSTLDESLEKIDYTIIARRKEALEENSDKNLSLTLTNTPVSNIKKLSLVSVNTETEENELKETSLEGLHLTSKASDEIIYKLTADVKKAKNDRAYKLVLGLIDENEKTSVISYDLKVKTTKEVRDQEEAEVIALELDGEEKSSAIGEYKKEGILGGIFASHDSITWTDYLVNEENENKEFTYDFALDENQNTENSQINLDYYELTENGFEIKKEFSQAIDFAEKINFEIPQGFVAKITLKTEVDKKNTAIKNYSLNNRVVKKPIYIEGSEEENKDGEEDPLPPGEKEKENTEESSSNKTENEKIKEENPTKDKSEESTQDKKEEPSLDKEEKTSDTEIKVTDSTGKEIEEKDTISALILNKDSLISKLEKEDKLTDELKSLIEELANNLTSYNEEKITDQELKDFTKALVENNQIEEADLRLYLESILSGLNKQKNKAANLNLDEIIDYAYPQEKDSEEEKSEKDDLTNLEKADKELKAALADEKNGIKEIQALLDSFEEKYNLSREDQEKLMTENDSAIKALVEKDRKENFRPLNLIESHTWGDKSFNLKLDMNVQASSANPIPAGWYFDVQLGPYLKEDAGQIWNDLRDDSGRLIAIPKYDEKTHTIKYIFQTKVTEPITLNVDQNLKFDKDNIGTRREIDIDIKVAPKNNPIQSMPTKHVTIDDKSPVESAYKVDSQGETKEKHYPFQLNWTSDQKYNGGTNPTVEWNIVVNTASLKANDVDFNNLNVSVFAGAEQGLKNFKFKASTNKTDLDLPGNYLTSGRLGEILQKNTSIAKGNLGDTLYIRVIANVDKTRLHDYYSIGLRINPDGNYIQKMLAEFTEEFNKLPAIIKWMKGAEQAKEFSKLPFNLVETMIPAKSTERDNFTSEYLYYDSSRTIYAKRDSDKDVDWYALDLLRLGEKPDQGFNNPEFLINNSPSKSITPKVFYYVPQENGLYRRTPDIGAVKTEYNDFYPGTLISYEYDNQIGTRDDTYRFEANIKEKKVNNLVGETTTGGRINLFTKKVSNKDLTDKYLAYLENPYPIMRINKNFDMVQCFNKGTPDPSFKGSDGIFLDIHEDPSGDYLISRLNENVGNPNQKYRLVNHLNGTPTQDGINLNPNNEKTQGQAMEDLMKRIYFYGNEVKKEYTLGEFNSETEGEIMHRLIENSMYQRVLHHFTDGVSIEEDFFDSPKGYNDDSWKFNHTLTGSKNPDGTWSGDQFDGADKNRKINGIRKLKDKETIIRNYPIVKNTQEEMARELLDKVIDSYKKGSDWSEAKASTVQLVFYSHTKEGQYQELITGRITEPLEIDKYTNDGKTKLEGATFTFINKYTNEKVTWTSKKDNNDKLYLKPGYYRVEEKAPNGYQPIKEFEIQVKRNEVNPDHGPYNFKGLPDIHVNDGYDTEAIIKDEDIPKSADGKNLVEIDKDNKVKVKLTNIQDNLGDFEFVKKNEFAKLNGAEFTLRKVTAESVEDVKNQIKDPATIKYDNTYNQKSTGYYGQFKFEQIPKGYYILEEKNPPAGYQKAPLYILEAKEETVAGKNKVVLHFVGDNIPKEKDGDLTIVRNYPKETEIEFRKIREQLEGEEKQGLDDARFRLESLWTKDGSTYLKDLTSDSIKKEGGKENEKGYFYFDKLKVGDYKLTEIQAPYGYQVLDSYWRIEVRENEKGELVKKVIEVKKDGTEVEVKPLTEPVELTNKPRTIDVKFTKYLGKLEKDDEGNIKTDEDGKPKVTKIPYTGDFPGKDNKPVSFDLYSSDYYGAIIGKKVDGKIQPIQTNITRAEDGFFHLKGLEFGKYYVLRETNPPEGYNLANDILLKVEAEAIASVGKMKVIVRDPNTNAETGEHSIFEGVIDFREGEQLGKFSIRKTGNAISYVDKDGKLVIINKDNPKILGLRRAYFRLYTANKEFEIEKNPGGYAKEYIQKVTPGNPIILYLTEEKAKTMSQDDLNKLGVVGYKNFKSKDGVEVSYAVDKDGKRFRIGEDPSTLPANQGIVTFDNLKPGYYVLQEFRGPAGYEKTTDEWYVYVDNKGRTYRSDKKFNSETLEQGIQSISSITNPSMSPRLQMAGLDVSEPTQFNRLMTAPLSDGLEISDEVTPQAQQATPSVVYAITNTFTNKSVRGLDVTTTARYEGNDTYYIRIDMQNNTNFDQNVGNRTIGFNREFEFVEDSTNTWKTPADGAEENGRWHTGYSNGSIVLKSGELFIKIGQTASIELKVKRKTDLAINRAYSLMNDIVLGPGAKLEVPKVTKIEGYKINYDNNHGKIRTEPYQYAKYNQRVTITSVTPHEGYDLIGKPTVKASGGSDINVANNNTFLMPRDDVTISANFVAKTYNIKYNNSTGGSVSGSKTAKTDENVKLDVRPQDGYKLKTLTVTYNNGKPVDVSNDQFTMPPGNVTVNAEFEPTGQEYTVRFDSNGGTGSMDSVNVAPGQTYKLPENGFTPPDSKIFKAWDVSGVEKQPGEIITINDNLTIKPVWDDEPIVTPDPYKVILVQPQKGGTISARPTTAKAGDTVTLSATPAQGYKFGKYVVTANGQPVTVNGNQFTMPASDVTVSATFVDDSTTPSEGEKTLEVNFTYSGSVNGNAQAPGSEPPGKLELFEEGNLTALETQNAINAGKVQFNTKLDPSKNYRLVYTREDKFAKDWALPNVSNYTIDSKSIADAKDTVSLNIANGNTMDIFNKDETGFRIPLRITKVNENNGVLTGAQFRARKLLKSDQIIDEKPPVYGNEEFDGVSEATGLPGDNYFRELSPGLYELTEIKAPSGAYRLPKDENGNDKKWYFKVEVAKDANGNYKKPSDDDYMKIEFQFTETLPENVEDARWAIPKKDRKELLGKPIKGIKLGDNEYDKFTQIIKDDHRSDPARPDAPYKGIDDVKVTNFLKTTEISFYKKDLATYQNIENAEFTLKRAKLGENGNITFDNDGNPQYENLGEKVKGDDGKEYDKFIKPEGYEEAINGVKKVSKKDAKVLFSNLEQGTYILKESKPADGYKLNDSFLAITLKSDEKEGSWKQEIVAYKKQEGKYVKVDNPESIFQKDHDGDLGIVFNNKAYINFKFQKIEGVKDKNGNDIKIESSDFRVTQVDEKGEPIPGGYDQPIYSYVNSHFTFRGLGVGRYKLQETRALEKYIKPDPWYFNVVQDPKTYKLKIVFEDHDASIRFTPENETDDGKETPKLDKDGNPIDIKVANYQKTRFVFKKQNQDGDILPDVFFNFKKLRQTFDSKAYDYDAVSGATYMYNKSARSQKSGSVTFDTLGEGIYELRETDKPEGYDSKAVQDRWIIQVVKTKNGLQAIYDKAFEKRYYEKYANHDKYPNKENDNYYTIYIKNEFDKKSNLEQKQDGDFNYILTNTKTTTELKWKKVDKDKAVIKDKETKFVMLKNSDDPTKLDAAKKGNASAAPYELIETDGMFEVNNLSKGIYTIIETKEPDGFKEMDRQIVIQIYEDADENYKLKKKFYEMKKDANSGKNVLVEGLNDFSYVFTRKNNTEVDTDGLGYFYVKNDEKQQYFYLTKGFLTDSNGRKVFNNITKGELHLKLTNEEDDKDVFRTTIDLAKDSNAGIYKFDVNGIKIGKTYLLEEEKAPEGYKLSSTKYRLLFVADTENTGKIKAILKAVLINGKDELKKNGQLVTEDGKVIGDGITIDIANPNTILKVINEKNKVEFTKVGKDKVKGSDGKFVDKEDPLQNVEFILEKQDPKDWYKENNGYYPITKDIEFIKKDDEGLYIEKSDGTKERKAGLFDVTIDNSAYKGKSDDKGKFTFEGLTNGFYQVIEPEAPTGYMQVNGSVKKFRVLDGKIYIYDKVDDKFVEKEVTDDNIGTLGKIINEKPGKGEFKLTKYTDLGKPMANVKFELFDTTADQTKKAEGTTDSNGEIHFQNLPYGYYWLVETKTKDGYKLDTRKRLVSLGGDKEWNVPDKNTDVSNKINFANSQADLESTTGNKYVFYPNQEEAVVARFKLEFENPEDIKPGNHFTLNLTGDVDIDGIVKDNDGKGKSDPSFLNLIGPAGVLAKAEVDKNRHTITYTFTDYVGEYTPKDMELFLQLYPNREKLVKKQTLNVTASIGDSNYSKSIEVDYRSSDGYQDPDIDVSSYMLRLEPGEKTFTAIVYYNQWNRMLTDKGIQFILDKNVDRDSLKVTTYKRVNENNVAIKGSNPNSYQTGNLPDSYGIVPTKDRLTKVGERYAIEKRSFDDIFGIPRSQILDSITVPYSYLNKGNYYINGQNIVNNDPMNTTYVIEIKGKLTDANVKSLKTQVQYYHKVNWYGGYNNYGYWDNNLLVGRYYGGSFRTWSQFYTPGGEASAAKEMQLINFRNRIDFVKIDGGVKGEVADTTPDEEGNIKESSIFTNDTIGEALEGAKFKLKKSGEADFIDGSERTSDDRGRFSWVGLSSGTYEVWETEAPAGYKKPTKMVSQFVVDKNGNITISATYKEIIENNKTAKIRVKKVDQEGNIIAGDTRDKQADFTLEGNNVKNWNSPTASTGADGYAVFEDIPFGNFELKESKAPKGYTSTGKTWKLTVAKDGRIAWTNSFDDTKDILKTATYTDTGNAGTNLDTKIVGIDKTKKVFRQYNLIKANKDDLKANKITITSPDTSIKLNQDNTRIRLVAIDSKSSIGNINPVIDDADYQVDYNGSSMDVSIKLPEEKHFGAVGSEPGGDQQKTYLVIVDMPYTDKVGASLSYKTENVDKTVVNDKSITEGQENHKLTVFKNENNNFYRPRLVNNLDFIIENIKQPDIYFEKVDAANAETKLSGAEFELQKKQADGTYKAITKDSKPFIPSGTNASDKWTATSGDKGKFSFEAIPDGEYKVVETKAPGGYSLINKDAYYFKVENGKITGKVKLGETYEELTENSTDKPIQITNRKAEYPSTGGPGVWIGFTVIGLAVMIAGAFIYNKRQTRLTE